ncbi:MAG TPA: hypothetical protein VFE96_00290, partial [Candidatus Bathyarchaeia archaeon]|nr:hypothetical protein [Candidatus Bathyarchaeia archaeon]
MTRDKDSDHWRESLSLRIPKGTGETAIRLLAKLELLDTALSPRTVGALLHVPLSRAPANAEKNELDKTIGEHRLSHERFHQRAKIGGSLEQALVGQIPAEIIHLVSKSFDVIGDIAIIELNPRTEIFEAIIAEAIMKLHNNVRAVFSKTGPISDDKRLRPLHHVAGEDKTETVHKEGGCRLKVD